MMVQVGGGIVYSGLESGRCVAKVGRKWRNFGGAGAESRTAGGAIRCEKPVVVKFQFPQSRFSIPSVA